MADEQTAQAITPQTESTPVAEVKSDPLAAEVERAHEAAASFLAENAPDETAKPDRPRGPDGKFLPKESTEPQGQEAAKEAPTPVKLDGAWMEAAKIAGFREDEIAAFKSDQDLQKEVMWRRQQVMQSAGIDPNEFQAFQQWRQQQQQAPQYNYTQPQQPNQPAQAQQPPPQQAPVQRQPLPDLKLEFTEEDIAPELAKPLRTMEQYANQLKATLGAENAQLKQMMVGLYGMVQQSAEAQQRAALEAQQAAEWDNAAKEVPGFVDVMGLPSEVRRMAQLNPNDPKVQNYVAFRAYFEPTYQRYAQVLGSGAPLPRVMADAFSASPFARLVGTNGNSNGKSGPQPGSVVRGTQRRGSSAEPEPRGNALAVEAERIHDTINQIWSQTGNNPFRE